MSAAYAVAAVGVVWLVWRLMASMASGSNARAAFAMSLGAGMATGIGALFVLCTSSLDRRLLAGTMAFSAGVMVYVSLVEVVLVANEHFAKSYPPPWAYLLATASFFGGTLIMAVVDRIVHLAFDAVADSAAASVGAADVPLQRLGRHNHHDGGDSAGGSGDEESCWTAQDGKGGKGGSGGAGEHGPRYDEDEALEAFEDESGLSIRTVAQLRERSRLLMMAAVVSAAIVLHNIPEGMA